MHYLRKLHPAGTHPTGSAVGVGYACAHHGELLQGVFEDPAGQLRRALVTLPLPGLGSRAVFHPSQHHWGIVGTPELTKVRRAAILTLRELSRNAGPELSPGPAKGGQLEITSDVPRGIGMGSSTSDVTATIRAVADYHGAVLSADAVGRLAVRAERASDSIMIDDRVVLFAHRDGEVLESLGHALPPLAVIGCDTAPGTRVDTLHFPPADYHDDEVAAFRVLRSGLRRAVATADPVLLGRVATASARINQRFLPKPCLDELLALCHRLGGCGVQVAHSGTVAGVMFDARRPDVTDALAAGAAAVAELGLVVTAVVGPGAGASSAGGQAYRTDQVAA